MNLKVPKRPPSAQKIRTFKPSQINQTSTIQSSQYNKHDRRVSFDVDQNSTLRQINQTIMNQSNMLDNPYSTVQQTSSLATQYKEKQKKLDEKLKQEIENYSYALSSSKSKHSQEKSFDYYDNTSSKSKDESQGFQRSKRSVVMRIKDNYESQVSTLETDKLTLIQNLNDSLVQLDKLSQIKTELSNKLVEQLKFVRDLQREIQKSEDLEEVVNKDLKNDYKQQKQANFKLQEKLKEIEIDKQRILQKLEDIDHTTNELQIESSDIELALQARSDQLELLETDYHHVKDQIYKMESDIEKLRIQTIQNTEMIDLLRDQINAEYNQRQENLDRYQSLQVRYDNAVNLYSRDKYDAEQIKRKHLQILASRLLFEYLEPIIYHNQKYPFNLLQQESKQQRNNIKGLIKMRKIFKQNKQDRLTKYFHIWYRNLLKPVKALRANPNISRIIGKKNQTNLYFNEWRHIFIQKQQHRLQQHQSLMKMIKSFTSYNQRVIKLYLRLWKDRIQDRSKNRNVLLKKLIVKYKQQCNIYFAKWRSYNNYINFQIRMNGMSQKLAQKQYFSSLFSQWRQVTQVLKLKRKNRLIRTWKNLKAYTMIQKQMRCQTTLALRYQKNYQNKWLKLCFDTLKINEYQEKFERVNDQLNQEELPKIQHLQMLLQNVQFDEQTKYKLIAMNVITKLQNRSVYGYFKKWKQETEYFSMKIHSNVRILLITTYKSKLRDAFTKWIKIKGKEFHLRQKNKIKNNEQHQKQLNQQIQQSQQSIQESQNRQKQISGKQLRKLVYEAFKRNLGFRFIQWKTNINNLMTKKQHLEQIITRYQRRLKRIAFDRYKVKSTLIKREGIQEIQVEQMRNKLNHKLQLESFNSFQIYATRQVKAKKYIKWIISHLNFNQKKNAFKIWENHKEETTEELMSEQQNEIVYNIQLIRDECGNLGDKLEEVSTKNNELNRRLRLLSQKVIQRWFVKCHNDSLQFTFERWKWVSFYQNKRESKAKKVICHLLSMGQEQSFRLWYRQTQKVKQLQILKSFSYESETLFHVNEEKQDKDKFYSLTQQQKLEELESYKKQQQILTTFNQNCMKTIIQRREGNFHIKKQRFILLQWHKFVKNRKLGIKLFGKAITKSLWQIALASIKDYTNQVKRQQRLLRHCQVTIRNYYTQRVKKAFKTWKENMFKKVKIITEDYGNQIDQIKSQQRNLEEINEVRILRQTEDSQKYIKKFNCFVFWRDFINKKRLLKIKINQFQTNQNCQNKKLNLIKWQQRKQKSYKTRRIYAQTVQKLNQLMIKNVYKNWKCQYSKKKRLLVALQKLENHQDHYYLQEGLQKIKNKAQIKYQSRVNSKHLSVMKIHVLTKYLGGKRLIEAFKTFRYNGWVEYKERLIKKNIINKWITYQQRASFFQWKQEASNREIIRYNLEEGPVKVQWYKLKQEFEVLKIAVKEEGFTQKQVEGIVQSQAEKQKQTIKKAILRMKCYNNDDYLKPYCLDRWREWVNERKLYRYWLNYLNRKVQPGISEKAYVFDKWRNLQRDKELQLQNIKKIQLEKRYIKDQEKLDKIADLIEDREDQIDNISEQRDMLLKGFVGSQRLALSSANASYERVKLKAFSRLISQTQRGNTQEMEDIVKKNVEYIQTLKDRITQLENCNEDIASQNEELRIGALDGIDMAKNVDALARDREKLTIDIADKAIIIKRLLEENNNLNTRLSHAQDEAQELLKTSQLKFQSNLS